MRLERLVFVAALGAAFLPRSARADEATPATPTTPTTPTTPAVDERARFRASFRFAGSSQEQAARAAAIDRGIDSLFFAIRGIARSRLSAGTKIDPWVAFSFDAQKIRTRIPLATDAISPENGTPVSYENDGERTKLSQRIGAGKLTQVFDAEEGRRVNEWVLSADAKTLWLRVTVSSPKLTRPVAYTLTYERVQ